jgi:hypothetical protein
MCIVWTSMLCAHHLNMNAICIFILFKHRCCMSICVIYTWKLCTQLWCLNNAWHLCLNNINLWNNIFCMDLKQTHETHNFVMIWQSQLPHHGGCSPNTSHALYLLNVLGILRCSNINKQRGGCEQERFGTMGIINFQKTIHVPQYSKKVWNN